MFTSLALSFYGIDRAITQDELQENYSSNPLVNSLL